MENAPKTNSKFLKISCPRCDKKHVIYGRATLKIKCEKCNKLLIKSSGGKSQIRAKVRKILWK